MSTSQTKSTGPYPRPRGIRAIRWILSRWWLVFVAYVGDVVFNLFGEIGQNGLSSGFSPVNILQAMEVGQIAYLLRSPQLAALAGMGLILLVVAGIWAHQDRKREAKARVRTLFARQFGSDVAEVLTEGMDMWPKSTTLAVHENGGDRQRTGPMGKANESANTVVALPDDPRLS